MPFDLGDLSGARDWPFHANALDQGNHGWCTGFGLADFGINDPIQDAYTNDDGKRFYYLCKVEDGEPGQENGSTVRSVAKVAQNIGRITAYAWAASTDEITYWLLHQGPVIVGVNWYYGMETPDAKNIIHPTGGVAGGHCFLLNEKTDNELYGLQNSWGSTWGVNGKAYISIKDFGDLLAADGEAMTAVEEPLSPEPPAPDPVKPGCWPTLKARFGIRERR